MRLCSDWDAIKSATASAWAGVVATAGTLGQGTVWCGNNNANGQVGSIVLQSDGKILIGGAFSNLATGGGTNLIRVNANGTLDSTFRPNPDLQVNFVRMLSDGRMFVGGAFSAISGIGTRGSGLPACRRLYHYAHR